MTTKYKNTSITIEADKIYTSRLIDNRLVSLAIGIDGSVIDLLEKCDNISSLSNELYKDFAEIKKSNEMDEYPN
tara:strand:- start:1096 stop:1317 length:222 start_codon:yes stop_codon:yes gene_type:complete